MRVRFTSDEDFAIGARQCGACVAPVGSHRYAFQPAQVERLDRLHGATRATIARYPAPECRHRHSTQQER